MDLLGSDSEDEKEIKFTINENYAKNYETWRKKEEKQKLLDRYGNAEDTSSSSEEEEIRSTPQMDKDWLRAYAVIRFQQPRLYKKGEHFFSEEAKPMSRKKEKATTLKDHERRFMLEKGGLESDDDSKPKQALGKSYFEEQEEIKKSFKVAVQDSSDEDDGLLVKKQKTLEEQRKEENEYLEWLKGEKDDLADEEAAAELAPLKAYWNDPNLSEKERVLRDYILNNGYVDQEDSSDESAVEEKLPGIPNFEGEEEFLEKAEEYEHKYNFRHEEPGGDEIKSYPRVIETSVRIKDTRRADQRQKKIEKKRQQKEQQREEIRLLQKLQKEERQEKLEKLRKIANNPELNYDLEAEFDPEEHNKIMQKFFSEDYYGGDKDAIQKPHFDYDEAIDDEPGDWWQHRLKEEKAEYDEDKDAGQEEGGEDEVNEEGEYEPGADDPDFIMDADYDPTKDYKAEKKKNKKKRSGLPEKLPLFDPSTKTFDEYIDEYLKDKIGTIPFTYREVVPNDFGLTTEEILTAAERELNTWVSVKKMSQYRSKQEELSERRKFLARARIPNRKLKVLPSLTEKETTKAKKKKKKKRKVITEGESDDAQISDPPISTQDPDTEESETTIAEKDPSNTGPKGVKRKRKDHCVSLNEVDKKQKKLKIKTVENVASKIGTEVKKAGREDVKGMTTTISAGPALMKGSKQGGLLKKRFGSAKQNLPEEQSGLKKGNKTNKKKKKKGIPQTAAGEQPVTVAKKKEKKKGIPQTAAGEQPVTVAKKKKKKMSIKIDGKSGDKEIKTLDSRQLQHQLTKVMSASRLSKFGIGPNAIKIKKKKKKKTKVSS